MNKDSASSLNHYCCSQLFLEEHNKLNVDQLPLKKDTTRHKNTKQICDKFIEKIPVGKDAGTFLGPWISFVVQWRQL